MVEGVFREVLIGRKMTPFEYFVFCDNRYSIIGIYNVISLFPVEGSGKELVPIQIYDRDVADEIPNFFLCIIVGGVRLYLSQKISIAIYFFGYKPRWEVPVRTRSFTIDVHSLALSR